MFLVLALVQDIELRCTSLHDHEPLVPPISKIGCTSASRAGRGGSGLRNAGRSSARYSDGVDTSPDDECPTKHPTMREKQRQYRRELEVKISRQSRRLKEPTKGVQVLRKMLKLPDVRTGMQRCS